MSKIQKLDAKISNMIAAGEVVERPMGVVKELVENAIDAHSHKIEVHLEEGGLKSITVIDDGDGMDQEDAKLCFFRHATSKIKSEHDLFQIQTLGFRGEALPSIASVSKLTLTTSDGHDCTRVIYEYGELKETKPYPCNQGTTVQVEGLFYQTPARLKHMRSSQYEASLIVDVMQRFALSYPQIQFICVSEQKVVFQTSGNGQLAEVIFQIYGRAAIENAIAFSCSNSDYQVDGYLIKPMINKANRHSMHVFLNDRMVKTYKLYQAIVEGYHDFIVPGRYPIVVLHIKMDPSILDVNVHPSKWEVRISKQMQLEELLTQQIDQTLRLNLLAPKIEVERVMENVFEQPKLQYEQPPMPIYHVKEVQPKQPQMVSEQIPTPSIPQPIIQESPKIEQRFPQLRIIGQLLDKYIVCEYEQGMVVIDQHAAQERVHYEELIHCLNQKPIMMDVLIPYTFHVGHDMVKRVEELNQAIADLHIQFEPFGFDTLLVRQVPTWMQDVQEQSFLQDILDLFKDEQKIQYTHLQKKKIATMACHSSIRFNHHLTYDEMVKVVEQLQECANPFHCPHGRPTFIMLQEKQFAREFLR